MNKHKIHIRSYLSQDKSTLLEILQYNIPRYFTKEEKTDFANYLDHEREAYFVVEVDNKIVGCGGINTEEKIGILSWAFLHPEFQGQGLGSQLVLHRIQYLLEKKKVSKIIVRTTQLTYKFYEKMGFKTVLVKKDFWAKGFDLYQMQYLP